MDEKLPGPGPDDGGAEPKRRPRRKLEISNGETRVSGYRRAGRKPNPLQ